MPSRFNQTLYLLSSYTHSSLLFSLFRLTSILFHWTGLLFFKGSVMGEKSGQVCVITRCNYTLFNEAVNVCCANNNTKVGFVGVSHILSLVCWSFNIMFVVSVVVSFSRVKTPGVHCEFYFILFFLFYFFFLPKRQVCVWKQESVWVCGDEWN